LTDESPVRKGNAFGEIRRDEGREIADVLAQSTGGLVVRYVSHGHASKPGFWYDQEESEFVMVLDGRARVAFDDGETVELGSGDYLWIPAHVRHRVEWTDPDQDTVWLCAYLAP
jgi:cupin 2 domain-containing protein